MNICHKSELPELMQFIDEHWSKGHILSTHKGLMDFQHKSGDYYNFVISRRGGINGILGFIPVDRHDPNDRGLWLAIWKALEPGVGVQMLRYLDCIHASYICAIGINENVKKLYETLGWNTGKLKHMIYTGDFNENITIPERPIDYLFNKYISHPFRNYRYFIRNYNCYVYRLLKTDVLFARIFDIFKVCIPEHNDIPEVEYFDCLWHGVDLGTNWKELDRISPVFTEPVLMENKDILFAHKGDCPMFKGYSDQDRPNIIDDNLTESTYERIS